MLQNTKPHLEDNNLEYVCKAKLNSSIRKIINYFNEQQHWQQLDDTYATAEIRIPLPVWERARRIVFIREHLKPVILRGFWQENQLSASACIFRGSYFPGARVPNAKRLLLLTREQPLGIMSLQ